MSGDLTSHLKQFQHRTASPLSRPNFVYTSQVLADREWVVIPFALWTWNVIIFNNNFLCYKLSKPNRGLSQDKPEWIPWHIYWNWIIVKSGTLSPLTEYIKMTKYEDFARFLCVMMIQHSLGLVTARGRRAPREDRGLVSPVIPSSVSTKTQNWLFMETGGYTGPNDDGSIWKVPSCAVWGGVRWSLVDNYNKTDPCAL